MVPSKSHKLRRIISALQRWLRLWLPADITLLAIPGNRFWHAHWRHLVCYGRDVYARDRQYAEEQRALYIREGYTLTYARNWRHRLHVHAEKPTRSH